MDARAARRYWRLDPGPIELFDPVSSPFADPRFLQGVEQLATGWSARRIGAVTRDGTHAAITLSRKQRVALSIPYGYGGIVADRSLDEGEVTGLLKLVARDLGVRTVISRYVPLPIKERSAHGGGRVIGSTQVVMLPDADDDLESRLAKKARQSIRRAQRAGVIASATRDPGQFLKLYVPAAKRFEMTYPPELIEALAASGLGRPYDATVDGEVVASAFALNGDAEWMYWLAAQTERGRRLEAGYLVVATILADALSAGARFVNLGASEGLPGVAKFKRRMGGVELPVMEHRLVVPPAEFIRSRIADRRKRL
jgi:GNAT acetyltransferase-like protein